MNDKGSIFVISSQVVSGLVGLKAVMPALRALDYETITLPTTLLAAHPAAFPNPGRPAGGPMSATQMLEVADWLLAAGAFNRCRAIMTGYLPSPAHVEAAAQIVTKIKALRPDMIYCCDPICGDKGALYLPQDVAAGLRTHLLPLADLATPNLFELAHLTGSGDLADTAQAIEAARSLDIAHVVVTSAPAPQGRIATLAVGETVLRCETACAPEAPSGMGDFFAALYLGLYLDGEAKALGTATATLADMAMRNMQTATLPHGPVKLAAPAITDKLPG
jgi:pyridoxine kinase